MSKTCENKRRYRALAGKYKNQCSIRRCAVSDALELRMGWDKEQSQVLQDETTISKDEKSAVPFYLAASQGMSITGFPRAAPKKRFTSSLCRRAGLTG